MEMESRCQHVTWFQQELVTGVLCSSSLKRQKFLNKPCSKYVYSVTVHTLRWCRIVHDVSVIFLFSTSDILSLSLLYWCQQCLAVTLLHSGTVSYIFAYFHTLSHIVFSLAYPTHSCFLHYTGVGIVSEVFSSDMASFRNCHLDTDLLSDLALFSIFLDRSIT